MSLPIEFRFYLRRYSDDDRKAGIQPVQQTAGPHTIELYTPPMLQFRVKSKSGWSEFADVPYVREGDEPQS